MSSRRRYNFGILFPTLIAISLLSSLSVAYGKDSRAKNLFPYRIVPLSSKDSLVLFDDIIDSLFEQKDDKRSHPGFKIFLLKLRTLPEEDWGAKVQFLNNFKRSAEHGPCRYSRVRFALPLPSPSQGFLFAFSGLSPPSA